MREAPDVPRLLERFKIEARRDGDELLARCPAHVDSKPSWSIHATTGRHHCFACGFGGTAASLVIHMLDVGRLGWTNGDAWRWLREHGLLIGAGAPGLDVELYLRPQERSATFILPASVRVGVPLSGWPTPAVRYLARREIPGWQVRRWGIGFAIDGRLGGRIVFPVRSREGRLLSYSARTFVGSPVRYLTPDADENPDRAALFGEEAWPAPVERRRVVVVEGAIKALAVERAASGVHLAGVLGATQASNPRVVAKLATFPEVVILLDADRAGEAAAEQLYGALARHVRASVRRMPNAPVDDAPVGEVREVLA